MDTGETYINTPQWKGYIVIKNITQTLSDTSFYYEYMITRRMMILKKPWQDQKGFMKPLEDLQELLLNTLSSPSFNPNKIPLEDLEARIKGSIKKLSQFDLRFAGTLVPQTTMLDYLSEGNWKYKNFSANDVVYSIRIEDEKTRLPLVWMVISVNIPLKAMRLHVWSNSLLVYFIRLLKLQEIPLYGNFGPYILGYVIHLFRNVATRLYYTPYSRNSITTQVTTNVLAKLTGGKDTKQIAPLDVDQDKSLGEAFFIELTDDVKNAYQNVNVRPSTVEMCITCEEKVGVVYTEEYGRGIRFCGEECFFTALRLNK